MKKLMRKLLAVVAAMTMVLAMAVPAMAATVTINPQTPEGSTVNAPEYKYYEMMKASVGTAPEGQQAPVSYYVETQDLADALDGLKVGNDDLFAVTKASGADRWNVVINKKSNGSAFNGEEVAAALDTIKEKAIATGTATNNAFSITGDGYVLVESSLGTKLVLETLKSDTIHEKNEYPSITKTEDVSNAEIGGTVTYKIPVVIPANVAEKDIVIVDTISKGLTLNTTIIADNGVTGLTWVLDSTDSTTEAKTYKVTIPATTVKENAGKTVTLTYTATINENAVRNNPETNTAHLEYDNYKSVETPQTIVKTFGFDLTKIGNGDSSNLLEGVKFTLQNSKNEYYTVPSDENNVNEDRFVNTKSEVATDKNGKIVFDGLAAGTYTLRETETNNGYNLLTGPLNIKVDENGNISVTGSDDINTTGSGTALTVNNVTGSALPSTGGMGTTIFYVLGAALVIGAGVILVTRRRLSK